MNPKKESQLRRMQEKEALGRLAKRMVHDFNNIWTTIRGYAELILPDLKDERQRDGLKQIIDATERGALLTQRLSVFTRSKITPAAKRPEDRDQR